MMTESVAALSDLHSASTCRRGMSGIKPPAPSTTGWNGHVDDTRREVAQRIGLLLLAAHARSEACCARDRACRGQRTDWAVGAPDSRMASVKVRGARCTR